MSSYEPGLRLQLFPVSARLQRTPGGDHLFIAGLDVNELAQAYGTPLYLYDHATMQASLQDYRQALALHYPGSSGLTYAGKAFLCTAIAQWCSRSELVIDCTGANEIQLAWQAGMPRNQILVHGVNKSRADLQAALEHAGVIVIDNLTELENLIDLITAGTPIPDLWLRMRPGLAVDTHTYTQTGQPDSKFGMSAQECACAVERCLELSLPLTGLHFHQGSHFHDPTPLAPAVDFALDFIQAVRQSTGWMPATLSPGGGWGVAYHEDDLPHLPVEVYVQAISDQLVSGCRERNLPLPRLQIEPGRSLIARAGVAIYRVGTVKHTPNRRWLLLDGGMADNIRPALYGARYSALPTTMPDRPASGPAWIAGPYCESGDILIADLPLPEIEPGELLAVPVSGAYQLSMSSNYNGAVRPAALWLDDGTATLIITRQSAGDLTRNDYPLP